MRTIWQDNQTCQSENYMNPTDDILNWVVCNDCKRWFHFCCAEITELPPIQKDYQCKDCQQINETTDITEQPPEHSE